MAAGEKSRGFPTSLIVFVASVILMLVIGAWFIYSGYISYIEGRRDAYQASVGVASLASAAYIIFQYRKRITRFKTEDPQMFTQLESPECGHKIRRQFVRGDYVFKKAENCPKCNNPLTVTRIFPEIKDKDKEKKAST